MTDLEAKAREIADDPDIFCWEGHGYEVQFSKLQEAILTALRSVRQEALEDAYKAVWDAGGDSTEFHCDAIRALKETESEKPQGVG